MKRRDRKKSLIHPQAPPPPVVTEPSPEARESGPSSFVAPEPAPVAPQEAAVIIREPASTEELAALHMLMMVMGQEMAQATINPDKLLQKIIAAARDPQRHVTLLAIKGDRLVGFLNLEKVDFYYSDDQMLVDWGFYVLPKYRGAGIGRELLRNAGEIVEAADMPAYVAINNPGRRRGNVATIVRFVPQGHILKFAAGLPPPRTN